MKKTLIDRINEFENHSEWNVRRFNEIFTECKLEDVSDDLEVTIGEIADSDTTRFLEVGKLVVKHSFQPRHEIEMPAYEVTKKCGTMYKVGPHTKSHHVMNMKQRNYEYDEEI